jgi:tripartite-type tricarboxylate transporter receptor subunit TctC
MKRSLQNSVSRRAVLAAAGSLLGAGFAMAQDYPARPVRLVVPFAAGTTTDIVSRVYGEALARALGQAVVVENRAGAGGNIGSDLVAKGQADGYTILMGTVGTHAINPGLYRKMPYDALRDFAPIGFAGYTPTLLVVAADSPLKTLKDLQARAARPGGVNFASAGNGTSGHLAGELLKARLGGEMVHVPYKEGGLALSDVMAGQVQFMFYHPAAVMQHIKSGKLRALGASSAKRSAAAPDVPTIAEQGFGEFDLVAWFMLYAPAAAPAPVLARLRDAVNQSVANPDVKARLQAQGLEVPSFKPDELASFGRALKLPSGPNWSSARAPRLTEAVQFSFPTQNHQETSMKLTRRHVLSATGAAGATLLGLGANAQTGAPVRIGSTLALTGPLSATALTHKLVGEIYVEQLNKRGGLAGSAAWSGPLKDDQSKPDLARTLYEQIITSDKVDLLMGPYATGAILSAMGVAQRYGKVLVHHTFGIPSLAKYDMQFPAWSLGADPQTTVSNSLFDMLAAGPKPPKTIAIVTSKFPSIHFMSLPARAKWPRSAACRKCCSWNGTLATATSGRLPPV